MKANIRFILTAFMLLFLTVGIACGKDNITAGKKKGTEKEQPGRLRVGSYNLRMQGAKSLSMEKI